MRVWGYCLPGVLAAFGLAGCTDAAGPPDEVGSARLALVVVPADVACVEVTAEGSRTVTRLFGVKVGEPAELMMHGLSLGLVRFSATALASDCKKLDRATATWVSDPVEATLVSGDVAEVKLTMRRNGRASVRLDFVEDPPPPGGPCAAGQHVISDGSCKPILFSDDFQDGVISDRWILWRKTFAESGGRMNVGDSPRPGFNYGADGRNAVLATHVGDPSWTDYRVDMDIESTPAGVFNPFGLTACTKFFVMTFRVARMAESWNEPANTSYNLEIHIPDCDGRAPQTVRLSSAHDAFGGSGVHRTLLETTSAALLDGPNHYTIEVKGDTIKLWVNGTQALDYKDDTVGYPPGSAPITHGGLAVQWVWETLGWVDNVVVTDLR